MLAFIASPSYQPCTVLPVLSVLPCLYQVPVLLVSASTGCPVLSCLAFTEFLSCLSRPLQGVLHCLAFTKFLSCLSRPPTGCPALPCLHKVSVLLVSAPHRVSCIALPLQSFCLACLGPPQGVLHCLAFTKFLSCLSRPPTGCVQLTPGEVPCRNVP